MTRITNIQQNPYIYALKSPSFQGDAVTNSIFNDKQTNDTFEYSKPQEKSSYQEELDSIKEEQGFFGKLWDGFKNLTHIGASSNKVEDKIKQYENGEISEDEVKQALEKYKAGQEMVVDVAGDMASGILAVGAFALALPTGGGSLVAGLALATTVGAGSKVAIKAGDALLAGREYSSKDLLYDTATGAVNGLFAPVTNGIGASVTKTIGTKMGLTVVKEGTEEIVEAAAKQGLKTLITQQGVDVLGGTFAKRVIATGAGMAVDGALGGATDNMIRATLEGENVLEAGVQGAIGGAIMAPVIGGGFKLAGKAGRALNNKLTTSAVLPDGMSTRFSQGSIGDCALLSQIDGMMNSPEASKLIKKAITKDIGGDYTVRIGSQMVKVAKDSLTDDVLSDTTGIKLFELAYKQLNNGNLDGGFAEVVAKQFGLNPVHIASDGLTDEMLDKLAKEQGSCVLSFGSKLDADGLISTEGSNHYFTIKNIDADGKKLTLSNPYKSGETFDISYEQAKKLGISIDGGSTKVTELPNVKRSFDDIEFRGKKSTPAKIEISDDFKKLIKKLGIDEDIKVKGVSAEIGMEDIYAKLKTYGIPEEEFSSTFDKLMSKNMSQQDAVNKIAKLLECYQNVTNSPFFTPFNLSLSQIDDIYDAVIENLDYDSVYDDILPAIELEMGSLCEEMNLNGIPFKTDKGKMVSKKPCDIFPQLFSGDDLTKLAPENLLSLGMVNGKEKIIIFPNSASIKNIKAKGFTIDDIDTLIKSNMITKDLVDKYAKYLPETKAVNVFGLSEKVPFDLQAICAKVQTNGFDSLTTYEIHALTDSFAELFESKSNTKFQNELIKFFKDNSKNYSLIAQATDYLQSEFSKAAQNTGVTIDKHALLRMLDRNAVSLYDNNKGAYLLPSEMFEIIIKNAKNGIKEFNIGSTKVELILSGKNIDTVILK